MKNTSIERIIGNSRKSLNKNIRSENKKSLKISIDMIAQVCKEIVEQSPDVKGKQLYNMFSQYIINSCQEYCKVANVRGMLFQLEAIKKLIGNKEFILREYEKVRDLPEYDENTFYTANISSACTNVVHQAVTDINKIEIRKEELNKKVIDIVKKYSKSDKKTRALMRNQNKNMNLSLLEKTLPIILTDDYVSKINTELNLLKEYVEEDIKDQQIATMEFLGEFFDDFGQTNIFAKKHLEKIQNITKADLKYEESTDKYDENFIGIKETFSREFLKNQSLEYILAYSLFWQNRFAKICKDINIAQFAITDMNLWDNIANGEYQFDISDNELQGICKKQIVLSELTAQLLTELREGINSDKVTTEKDGYTIKIYDEEKIEQYQKQEGKNYSDVFKQINPNAKNSLKNDLCEYKTFFNQVENAYRVKDSILGFKIRELFDSKKTKNWGIIEENGNNGDKVLIGIDYEGINMPLRLHIDKKLLATLIRLKNNNAKIPLYEGHEDFTKEDEVVLTNVLMPITKEHKTNIRNRLRELSGQQNDETNFLEHLLFLTDQDKYPNHLRKNGKRPSKRYIDLDSGDTFTKEGTQFIKVEKQNKIVGANDGR